jgi:hypothetical protein
MIAIIIIGLVLWLAGCALLWYRVAAWLRGDGR